MLPPAPLPAAEQTPGIQGRSGPAGSSSRLLQAPQPTKEPWVCTGKDAGEEGSPETPSHPTLLPNSESCKLAAPCSQPLVGPIQRSQTRVCPISFVHDLSGAVKSTWALTKGSAELQGGTDLPPAGGCPRQGLSEGFWLVWGC